MVRIEEVGDTVVDEAIDGARTERLIVEYEHWNGSAADFCRQRGVSRGSLALWRRCCGGGAVVKAAQVRRMKQVEGSGSRQMWTQCVLVLVNR